MSNALVFSIEEFSIFDGPGIRMSVFLKGCPLRCEWCHNPEGQKLANGIVRSPNGCIACGACERYSAQNGDERCFTEDSIKNCPQNLLRYCAREYSSAELCALLEKNLDILNASGGGVTFSGGEPTSNHKFLLECLALLRGKTNRAVQTCGFCSSEIFNRVLSDCDYVLFDIKLVDDADHVRYTGVSNESIIKNFKTLVASRKDFVIRTPLIPTVTDTDKNIRDIAKLLSDNGVDYIELLPYNKMTGSKYKLDGREYSPSFDESIPVSLENVKIFDEYGIKYKIL